MATAQTHILLEAALTYAARDWYVVPLHDVTTGVCSCGQTTCKPGKHPRITDWTHTASTEGAQIRAWWQEWPTANVGIQTGQRSKLVVLDTDPRNGGDVSRDLLRAALWPPA